MISDLVFIDSFQFMSSSLSDLADNLSKESFHQAKNTLSSDALEFIIKKKVYTYDYMDGFRRFEEKELPPENEFYSKLTDKNISGSDYEHSQTV